MLFFEVILFYRYRHLKVLHEAERKLVQLSLKESQLIYDKMDKELNDTIKSSYLENSEEIKNEIIHRNLTLRITLNKRRVKEWRKFKQKKHVIKSTKQST